MIRDELGCAALLAVHPECRPNGTGGATSTGEAGGAGSGGSADGSGDGDGDNTAGSDGSGGRNATGGSGGGGSGGAGSGGARTDGLRNYACGYAMAGVSGNPCENGRTTDYVVAKDMTAAIAACWEAQPADREYFCCVLDSDGTAPTDQSQCEAALPLGPTRIAPAWRPGRSCCRFGGETTCPAL
jgi:hypothetical protein